TPALASLVCPSGPTRGACSRPARTRQADEAVGAPALVAGPPCPPVRKERVQMAIPFVYVRAGGSYREIGRQVGEAARPQIEASVAFYADNFEAMSGGLSFGEA